LLFTPTNTFAQEPSSNTYGSDLTTPARRPLDTWGRGPFCWSCHTLAYPSPPDWRPGEPEIFMKATPMESGLKRLTDSLGRDIGAVYHPNEDRILWVTDSLGNWTIWSMNDDGSSKKQLTSETIISGWPCWSPDGEEISYWSYDPGSKTNDIWKMKSNGSYKVRLTIDGSFKGPPVWSPKGDRIAYATNITGNVELYVMNTDGSEQKKVTSGHTWDCFLETRPTWHTDGIRLYYSEAKFPLPPGISPGIPGDIADVEIHMINVDTGEDLILTPRCHDYVHSVSSDGKKLAIISNRSPNYGLWVMNSDGTDQTRLTWDGYGDRTPKISSDGKKILYWSLVNAFQGDVYVCDYNGGNKIRLTANPNNDAQPIWSPNENKIVFESDRSGNFDLWLILLDQDLEADVSFDGCLIPGDKGEAFLSIRPSNHNFKTIKIDKVGLHFDWDDADKYVWIKDSIPKILSRQDDRYHVNFNFSVPERAELGYHFYDVRIQYSEKNIGKDEPIKIFEQTAGDLLLGTLAQTECVSLYRELSFELERIHGETINRSIEKGEFSAEMVEPLMGYLEFLLEPEADYFLEANDEFYQANSLYIKGNYEKALPHFQKAKTILINHQITGSNEQLPVPLVLSTLSTILFAALTIILTQHYQRKKKNVFP
jgi:Tol biopolymer transport system component